MTKFDADGSRRAVLPQTSFDVVRSRGVVTLKTENSPSSQPKPSNHPPVQVAELISVGTELLFGEIVDTNAAYLSQELKNRGVYIYWKSTVGDNQGRVVEAIRRALSRSDLVILGGGLGPTDDDLTRESIAEVVGETPVVDHAYLQKLRAFFESRGRSFPESNSKQAWVLPSGEALDNPVGTAPGWFVRVSQGEFAGKIITALPGPPREMTRMWREQVLPRLILPTSSLYAITFRTFAIGESHVAERLAEWTKSANPSVATYARRDGVHVRVAASGASLEAAQANAQVAVHSVRAALEGHIFGSDEQTLAGVIGERLLARAETVASLESLTGGLILDELTNVPGASRYVQGGAVAYTNDVKLRMGVNASTLEQHGAISREVALEMALAARECFGASWGVATTGEISENYGAANPGVKVFVAIASPDGRAECFESTTAGDRRTFKERVAMTAMGQLWRALSKMEPS
jgi:nicotinamide-nucleotide amidase